MSGVDNNNPNTSHLQSVDQGSSVESAKLGPSLGSKDQEISEAGKGAIEDFTKTAEIYQKKAVGGYWSLGRMKARGKLRKLTKNKVEVAKISEKIRIKEDQKTKLNTEYNEVSKNSSTFDHSPVQKKLKTIRKKREFLQKEITKLETLKKAAEGKIGEITSKALDSAQKRINKKTEGRFAKKMEGYSSNAAENVSSVMTEITVAQDLQTTIKESKFDRSLEDQGCDKKTIREVKTYVKNIDKEAKEIQRKLEDSFAVKKDKVLSSTNIKKYKQRLTELSLKIGALEEVVLQRTPKKEDSNYQSFKNLTQMFVQNRRDAKIAKTAVKESRIFQIFAKGTLLQRAQIGIGKEEKGLIKGVAEKVSSELIDQQSKAKESLEKDYFRKEKASKMKTRSQYLKSEGKALVAVLQSRAKGAEPRKKIQGPTENVCQFYEAYLDYSQAVRDFTQMQQNKKSGFYKLDSEMQKLATDMFATAKDEPLDQLHEKWSKKGVEERVAKAKSFRNQCSHIRVAMSIAGANIQLTDSEASLKKSQVTSTLRSELTKLQYEECNFHVQKQAKKELEGLETFIEQKRTTPEQQQKYRDGLKARIESLKQCDQYIVKELATARQQGMKNAKKVRQKGMKSAEKNRRVHQELASLADSMHNRQEAELVEEYLTGDESALKALKGRHKEEGKDLYKLLASNKLVGKHTGWGGNQINQYFNVENGTFVGKNAEALKQYYGTAKDLLANKNGELVQFLTDIKDKKVEKNLQDHEKRKTRFKSSSFDEKIRLGGRKYHKSIGKDIFSELTKLQQSPSLLPQDRASIGAALLILAETGLHNRDLTIEYLAKSKEQLEILKANLENIKGKSESLKRVINKLEKILNIGRSDFQGIDEIHFIKKIYSLNRSLEREVSQERVSPARLEEIEQQRKDLQSFLENPKAKAAFVSFMSACPIDTPFYSEDQILPQFIAQEMESSLSDIMNDPKKFILLIQKLQNPGFQQKMVDSAAKQMQSLEAELSELYGSTDEVEQPVNSSEGYPKKMIARAIGEKEKIFLTLSPTQGQKYQESFEADNIERAKNKHSLREYRQISPEMVADAVRGSSSSGEKDQMNLAVFDFRKTLQMNLSQLEQVEGTLGTKCYIDGKLQTVGEKLYTLSMDRKSAFTPLQFVAYVESMKAIRENVKTIQESEQAVIAKMEKGMDPIDCFDPLAMQKVGRLLGQQAYMQTAAVSKGADTTEGMNLLRGLLTVDAEQSEAVQEEMSCRNYWTGVYLNPHLILNNLNVTFSNFSKKSLISYDYKSAREMCCQEATSDMKAKAMKGEKVDQNALSNIVLENKIKTSWKRMFSKDFYIETASFAQIQEFMQGSLQSFSREGQLSVEEKQQLQILDFAVKATLFDKVYRIRNKLIQENGYSAFSWQYSLREEKVTYTPTNSDPTPISAGIIKFSHEKITDVLVLSHEQSRSFSEHLDNYQDLRSTRGL